MLLLVPDSLSVGLLLIELIEAIYGTTPLQAVYSESVTSSFGLSKPSLMVSSSMSVLLRTSLASASISYLMKGGRLKIFPLSFYNLFDYFKFLYFYKSIVDFLIIKITTIKHINYAFNIAYIPI